MTFDVLQINFIDTVVEGEGFKGGIENIGSFDEGFCFKVKTIRSQPTTWVLCSEKEDENIKLMDAIKKLKLLTQRMNGEIITERKKNPETLTATMGMNESAKGPTLTGDEKGNKGVNLGKGKITDGYWIILQSWSQCSLKCGGGTSTLHRMCIPPKSGGKPCVGEGIVNRPCNKHKCPDIFNTNATTTNTTETLEPTVKVMPFSSNPQRYSKCILKESDLMMTEDVSQRKDSRGMQEAQIPVRVVMNNKTLAVFAGFDYNDEKISFELRHTNFFPSAEHKHCFILSDTNKIKAEFCPFGFDKNQDIVEQWDYDFNLFKYQCHIQKPIVKIKKPDEKKIVSFNLILDGC